MLGIVRTVNGKGKITLPSRVRSHLGIAPHSKVAFFLDDPRIVRIEAMEFSTIAGVSGAAGTPPTPMSWEEIRAIAREEQAAAAIAPG